MPCVQDPDEIGIGLCGLSSTGTYVESVRELKVGDIHSEGLKMISELQAGDKILAINGQTAGKSILEMTYNNYNLLLNSINNQLMTNVLQSIRRVKSHAHDTVHLSFLLSKYFSFLTQTLNV